MERVNCAHTHWILCHRFVSFRFFPTSVPAAVLAFAVVVSRVLRTFPPLSLLHFTVSGLSCSARYAQPVLANSLPPSILPAVAWLRAKWNKIVGRERIRE